jgi:hypothetical protein
MRSRCQYSSVQTKKSAQQSTQQWWKVDELPSPRKHWRKSAATRSPISLMDSWWTSPEEGDWVDKHQSRTELAISVDDQVSWTPIASSNREKMIGDNEPITDGKRDQHCKYCDGWRVIQMVTPATSNEESLYNASHHKWQRREPS